MIIQFRATTKHDAKLIVEALQSISAEEMDFCVKRAEKLIAEVDRCVNYNDLPLVYVENVCRYSLSVLKNFSYDVSDEEYDIFNGLLETARNRMERKARPLIHGIEDDYVFVHEHRLDERENLENSTEDPKLLFEKWKSEYVRIIKQMMKATKNGNHRDMHYNYSALVDLSFEGSFVELLRIKKRRLLQ